MFMCCIMSYFLLQRRRPRRRAWRRARGARAARAGAQRCRTPTPSCRRGSTTCAASSAAAGAAGAAAPGTTSMDFYFYLRTIRTGCRWPIDMISCIDFDVKAIHRWRPIMSRFTRMITMDVSVGETRPRFIIDTCYAETLIYVE